MAHQAVNEKASPKNNGQGDIPVAVIGGGLVGSLQALYLAKRGYKVLLFESREDIRKFDLGDGRSINLALSFRGQEALKVVDCEEDALSFAIPMKGRMIHSLDGKMSSQAYSTEGKAIYSIDRLKLSQLLLNAVEADPNITLCFEHKLIRADLKKQSLTFQAPEGEKELMVGFTFGCDGTFSTVRRQMMRSGDQFNYTQKYIEHGYKELHMPPNAKGEYAMPHNYLHIWPRHEFMMIALPNLDKSFTLTLFMPFKMFNDIKTKDNLLSVFMKHFPDSIEKIGEARLVEDYFKNPTGSLMSIKCSPYYHCSTVLLGDAAHAVVPFYGQGMNAGMEDCLVFDECLEKVMTSGGVGDLEAAAKAYSEARWRDGHAIAKLSKKNYDEMRSHVTSSLFLLEKKIENTLYWLFPKSFIPKYTMVTFTRMHYHDVIEKNNKQEKIIKKVIYVFAAVVLILLLLFALIILLMK